MIIPVRCFSCGKVIGHMWETYEYLIKKGEDPGEVLDKLGLRRYCCRRMLLTTVETVQQVIPFYEAMHKRNQEVQSELE